jgi:ubiquinone/menaquinone biosynthesis C-methylase UbiE
MSFDPSAFKNAQRENWNNLSSSWDKWYDLFETGAARATGSLLAAAGLSAGQHVLDLGSGTGQPALAAAALVGPSGRVTSFDQAARMLAIARRRAEDLGLANIEFVEGDLEGLHLPEQSFDAMISRWSLMFLPDPDAALRAAHDALRPGGPLAATVWGPAPKVPLLSAAFGIAADQIGLEPPPPGTPSPFSMADPQQLAAQVAAAGFAKVEVDECPLVFAVASAEEFADFSWELLPGWLRQRLAAQNGDTDGARLRRSVIEVARAYETDLGTVNVPCLSYLVRAVRP